MAQFVEGSRGGVFPMHALRNSDDPLGTLTMGVLALAWGTFGLWYSKRAVIRVMRARRNPNVRVWLGFLRFAAVLVILGGIQLMIRGAWQLLIHRGSAN